MFRYPYIADKKLYAAVMFACKMIREDGFFHKDCETATDYYDVDSDDVEKEVRKRQAAGQRGRKRKSGYTFKYFVLVCDAPLGAVKNMVVIQKGTTARNAERKAYENNENIYGAGYRVISVHATPRAAEKAQKKSLETLRGGDADGKVQP